VKIALFVPCYIDQLHPHVAIAALRVLERLGIDVDVPDGAACCGQPPSNAGFEHDAERALARFARTFRSYDRVVVLSGSCAVHVRAHAASVGGAAVAERTTELCAFLHDEVGLDRVASLGAELPRRVGVHVGCHALRGLGLATPSEIQRAPRVDKVRALLSTVRGLSFAEPVRPDECCGFGGTFAVAEPEISSKMGRDRLRDYAEHGAEAIVSTDVSCLMHLGGLTSRAGRDIPMVHVAEVLAGVGTRDSGLGDRERRPVAALPAIGLPERQVIRLRRAQRGASAPSPESRVPSPDVARLRSPHRGLHERRRREDRCCAGGPLRGAARRQRRDGGGRGADGRDRRGWAARGGVGVGA
jgi:L-lactate dehydrogenase complex protein LldE